MDIKNLKIDNSKTMILNLWPCVNYGASLTCYGVQCLLERLGYSPKVINYVPKIRLKYEGSFAENFAKKYLNLTQPVLSYNDFLELNKHCHNFIVGSDQVFNGNIMQTHSSKVDNSIWLLDFVSEGNKKISYSASFGFSEMVFAKEIQSKMQYYFPQFDSISVREDDGVKLIKEHFDIDSVQLIDGAFHIPQEKLDQMTKDYPKKEDYIACFMLPYYSKNTWYKELLPKIQAKYNCPIKYFDFEANLSVEEWLAFIKNSKFVVTDSYHSTVFSIIFEKDFIHIKKAKTQSRFDSLFRLLELNCISIDESSKNIDIEDLISHRDFAKAKRIISNEVIKAENWIKASLEKSKEPNYQYVIPNEVIQIQRYKIIDIEKKIQLISQREEIKKRYYFSKVLSKITFGKTRKKYKELRNQLKPIYSELRKCSKFNIENFK